MLTHTRRLTRAHTHTHTLGTHAHTPLDCHKHEPATQQTHSKRMKACHLMNQIPPKPFPPLPPHRRATESGRIACLKGGLCRGTCKAPTCHTPDCQACRRAREGKRGGHAAQREQERQRHAPHALLDVFNDIWLFLRFLWSLLCRELRAASDSCRHCWHNFRAWVWLECSQGGFSSSSRLQCRHHCPGWRRARAREQTALSSTQPCWCFSPTLPRPPRGFPNF